MMVRDILNVARRHLAQNGAAGLSLRAVSFELGVVPSAIYHYFPSRDDLIADLIIAALEELGDAVEDAEWHVDRASYRGRFVACCLATRRWALDNPHEYRLIFGASTPGSTSPAVIARSASRVPRVLAAIFAEAAQSEAQLPSGLRSALRPIRRLVGDPTVSEESLLRGIVAWTEITGAVSYELLTDFHGLVAEGAAQRDRYFRRQVSRMVSSAGLD